MRQLETKVLEPDDTVGPDEEHHARTAASRSCRRWAAPTSASPSATMARFRVAVFKQRGNIGMVLRQIPNEFLTFEQLGLPAVVRAADHAAARPVPGHRADRLGQDDQPGRDDQLHQRELSTTTSSRSKTRSSTTTSTRSRTVNQREIGVDVPDFSEAHPPRLADGPRRDPGRRNARPGDDPGGHHRGRTGPHRVRHAAHQLGRGHGQPHHRRLPEGPAGPDPHAALGRDHRRPVPGAAAAQDRRGWSPPTRCWWSRRPSRT